MYLKIFIILSVTFLNLSTVFSYDDFKANHLIISKLTNLKENLAKKHPSWSGVNLRLADLLAEQSRLCVRNNCTQTKILNFRKQAISLYTEILPSLSSSLKLRVYAQLGHLLQLSNKNLLAVNFYKKALTLKEETVRLVAIKMSLAQVYFKIGSYQKAIVYYDQVLKEPSFNKYNLAIHKKSWALFRLNKIRKAIGNLESLISKNYKEKTLGLVKVDPYFYSELLKDLVLFYSYKKTEPLVKAKKILSWSSKNNQVKYLNFFAQELERLGHLEPSLKVWTFNLDYIDSTKERILAYQHITQSYYKSFLFKKAAMAFSSLAKECQKNISECRSYEVNLKNLLIDWLATKKSKELLLQNCEQFIDLFPNNGDILVLSAQLARSLKKWPLALSIYKKIDLGLTGKTLVFKNKNLSSLSSEHFLWAQIEVAELSKKIDILQATYTYFINKSKDVDKVFNIQYQKFVLAYENKKNNEVINKFPPVVKKYLAIKKSLSSTLIYKVKPTFVKAANLVLQSLVKLNKDKEIEEWVLTYKDYPFAQTKSWRGYKNQAVLNQVSKLSQEGRHTLAYGKLINMPEADLSTKERVAYYYNQLSLLEKLANKNKEEVIIEKLLSFKKNIRSKKYIQLILRKVWLSELRLDFKTAFIFLKKLVRKKTSSDRYLRLILFAQLSDQALPVSHQYYKQFFKKEKDVYKKQALALDLIKDSNFKLVVFNKYQSYLLTEVFKSTSLAVLNQLSQEGNKLQVSFLYSLLKSKRYKNSSKPIFLNRFSSLEREYRPWVKRIAGHQIKIKTQRQIVSHLKRRLFLVSQGERLLQQAAKKQDSVLQMFYSFVLVKESNRLYTNILSLPLPKGLSVEESAIYTKVLAEKANVYKSKQEYYQTYYTQFWKNSVILATVEKQTKGEEKNHFLLKLFLNSLKKVAPESVFTKITSLEGQLEKSFNTRNISSLSKNKLSNIKVNKLREQVKMFPGNREYLKKLIEGEKKVENYSMVEYLNSRLLSLDAQTSKGGE